MTVIFTRIFCQVKKNHKIQDFFLGGGANMYKKTKKQTNKKELQNPTPKKSEFWLYPPTHSLFLLVQEFLIFLTRQNPLV